MAFPAVGVTPPALLPYQFSYNGYTFGPYTPLELTKIEGIDMPSVRSGDAGRARDHGRFIGLDVMDGRDVTITGELAQGPPLVQNLVPDPSFEYDTVGSLPTHWGLQFFDCTQVTAAVQSSWAASGSKSLRITSTASTGASGYAFLFNTPSTEIPVVGNQQYYAQATYFVYPTHTGGELDLGVYWFDSSGTQISTSSAQIVGTQGGPQLASGVYSLAGNVTAPANAAYGRIRALSYLGTGQVADWAIDAISLSPTNGGYNDGDQPGWEWSGTPGNSVSQTYQGGQSLFETWTNLSTATIPGGAVESPLFFCTPFWGTLVTMARVRKRNMPFDIQAALGGLVNVAMQFSSSDPRWYTTPTQNPNTTAPGTTAGFAFPMRFPLSFGGGTVAGTILVTNTGNIESRPLLVVTGPCTNPSMTNSTIPGAPNLTFDLSLNTGDQLVIDTDFHTATFFTAGSTLGSTRIFKLAQGSQWWSLQPGVNSIQFVTADPVSSGSLTVEYASALIL